MPINPFFNKEGNAKLDILKRYEDLGETFVPESIKIRQALRINTLKITSDELIKRMSAKNVKLEKIDFLKEGYYFKSKFSMGATPEYLQGFYYLQEAASQLPAIVLDPKEGERVLDMAASPGSKTTQIAQYMKNTGVVVAVDNNPKRIQSLRNNLERLSVKNTIVVLSDARSLSFKEEFDKITLDAPCSGNFCVERNFFDKRNVADFLNRGELQKKLLESAVSFLKKGGTLVYSTCSLEPEEDELVIDWLLKAHPEMKLEPTGLSIGDKGLISPFGNKLDDSISKCRRLWPHKTGTQGFFIAKLIKQ